MKEKHFIQKNELVFTYCTNETDYVMFNRNNGALDRNLVLMNVIPTAACSIFVCTAVN